MGPPGAWSLGTSCMPRAPPKFPSSKPSDRRPWSFCLPLRLFRAHHGPCSAPPCHPRWPASQGSGPCAGCCAQQRGPFRCITPYEIRRALFRPLAAVLGRWAASRSAGSSDGLADDGSNQSVIEAFIIIISNSSSSSSAGGLQSSTPSTLLQRSLAARSGKSLACLNRGEQRQRCTRTAALRRLALGARPSTRAQRVPEQKAGRLAGAIEAARLPPSDVRHC